LRPLYDALYDLMGFEKVAKLFERAAIEIAPLAFMRGRTLNHSFIILDEAQNTTPEQMKMFLTRIGFGSRAVVTGDVTQIDLARGQKSGLVEAGRILAGVTFSQPGNWTSWPPHEHGAMLEEAYLYINMPAPAFGVQLVYTDTGDPELATIVRENDVVLMPQGYHPNVAAPGGSINFLWMMAAHREQEDRQFGVVNVQPDFATGGSGLDPGRTR
jgi:hypothetical protein